MLTTGVNCQPNKTFLLLMGAPCKQARVFVPSQTFLPLWGALKMGHALVGLSPICRSLIRLEMLAKDKHSSFLAYRGSKNI